MSEEITPYATSTGSRFYVRSSDNTADYTINNDDWNRHIDMNYVEPYVETDVPYSTNNITYVTSPSKHEELFYMLLDLCKVLRGAIKTKEVSDIIDGMLALDDREEIDVEDEDDDYRID